MTKGAVDRTAIENCMSGKIEMLELENSRLRYLEDEIYTLVGTIMIAINPFMEIDAIYGPEVMKRYAGKEGKNVDAVDPADCRCLVRAVGSKQKISCMLAAKDYRRFMKAYGNILKISLDALKKREKKKIEKKKGAKAAA